MVKWLLIGLIVIAGACKRHHNTIFLSGPVVPAEIEYLKAEEGKTPANFLVAKAAVIKKKKNFFGQQTVTGTVLNNAKYASFDSVTLTLHFMDARCNEVGAHTFSTHSIINPGQKLGFQIKVFVPDSTTSFEYSVEAKEAL